MGDVLPFPSWDDVESEDRAIEDDAREGSRNLLAAILLAQGIEPTFSRPSLLPTEETEVAPVRALCRRVGLLYGYDVKAILGPRRTRDLARARWSVMWFAHESGIAASAIARAMDRDHTTVLHALRTIEADDRLLADIETLRERMI